jgi:hypothetical protein
MKVTAMVVLATAAAFGTHPSPEPSDLSDTVVSLALVVRRSPEAVKDLRTHPQTPWADLYGPVFRAFESVGGDALTLLAFSEERCVLEVDEPGRVCASSKAAKTGRVFVTTPVKALSQGILIVISGSSPEHTEIISMSPSLDAHMLYNSLGRSECAFPARQAPLRLVLSVTSGTDGTLTLREAGIHARDNEPRRFILRVGMDACSLTIVDFQG